MRQKFSLEFLDTTAVAHTEHRITLYSLEYLVAMTTRIHPLAGDNSTR